MLNPPPTYVPSSHLLALLLPLGLPGGLVPSLLRVHGLPPPLSPDGDGPQGDGAEDHEAGRDGTEPTHAHGLDGREADGAARGGEHVPDHVVAGHDLGAQALGLHDVQAVGVEAREAEQLRDALGEHGDHGHGHAPDLPVDGPAVDEHRRRDDAADEDVAAPQPVLGHPPAPPRDPLLDDVVGEAAPDEGAQEVAAAGGDVEQARQHGAGEVEARVEHVPDGREERVHVPHEAAARDPGDDEVGVAEQQRGHAQRADPVRDPPGPLGPGQVPQVVDLLGRDRLGQDEQDERGGHAAQGRLQPEDDPPRPVGDDDAADERPERGADQRAAEEPAQGGRAGGGRVDVAEAARAHDQEARPLVGREHAEDEVAGEVGREGGADAEGEEEPGRRDADPPPAVDVRERAPEARAQAHEDQVDGVGDVDDAPAGVERLGDLGDGRQDGRAGYGRQEPAERQDHRDQDLPAGREAFVLRGVELDERGRLGRHGVDVVVGSVGVNTRQSPGRSILFFFFLLVVVCFRARVILKTVVLVGGRGGSRCLFQTRSCRGSRARPLMCRADLSFCVVAGDDVLDIVVRFARHDCVVE